MPFMKFLRDYEKHKLGNVADVGRYSHCCSLVAQEIARWATEDEIREATGADDDTGDDVAIYDEGSSVVAAASIIDFVGGGVTATAATSTRATVTVPVFSEDVAGVANGPTAAEIAANKVLRADNTWVDQGHTGTTGSVFFAGAGGAGSQPTEDNANFFYDDTNNRLGVGTNSPRSRIHAHQSLGAYISITASETSILGSSTPLGGIEWLAPNEDSGGDANLVAASIKAIPQAPFTSTVNNTDLVFSVALSEEAPEVFRIRGEKGLMGIGTGSDVQARLHVQRTSAVEDDWLAYFEHTGTISDAVGLAVQKTGDTRVDFGVWQDGRCSIGLDEATTNAMLRIESINGGPNLASTLFVSQERTSTNSVVCAWFTSEGDTADCVIVDANSLTTAVGIDVSVNALTTGAGIHVSSSSTSVAQRSLASLRNTNSAATGCRPLYIEQFADGKAIEVRQNASDILWQLFRTGHQKILPLASNTDAAPTADATLKKISTQYKTGGPPSNANYLQYIAPGGGTTDFYQVLEEG